MLRLCLALIVLLLAAGTCCALEGVTFRASFDRWVIADSAREAARPLKQVGGALGTGRFGQALVLDGNSYVEYAAGKNLGATAATVAMWFRPDDWGARTYDNLFGLSETDTNGFHLERSNPDGRLRLVLGGPQSKGGGDTRSLFSKGPLQNGQWVHVAASYDREKQRAQLWLNGQLEAELSGPGPLPDGPPSLLVGCGWGRLGRAVKGAIDDLVILDHQATAEELLQIMAGVSPQQSTDLSNATLAAAVDAAAGRLTIGSRSAVPELYTGAAAPAVVVGGNEYTWEGWSAAPSAAARAARLGPARHAVFTAPANDSGLALRYHLQVQQQQPLALLWAELMNATAQPVKVEKLHLLRTLAAGDLCLGAAGEEQRIFTDNGGLMGSGSHDLQQPNHDHVAHGALVVTAPASGRSAAVSFASFRTATVTNAVHTGADGKPAQLTATCDYPNGYLLPPGATLQSEVLAVGVYGDPHQALSQWADAVMAVGELQPPRFCPSGWNSWYCYRLTITEDLVLQNARFIRDHLGGLGLENIQIDHGWQDRDIVGNWVVNKRFPHGLPWLSAELKKLGFSLGLWTAVTNISEFAPFYQEHPEALIQGADGKPLVTGDYWFWEPHGKTFTLDPTDPAGLAQFRKVGEDLRSYGCTYNKNDFQGDLLTGSGTLHDKTLTRGAPVYRLGMGEFARGKGRDMAYHACNAPLNVVAGLCDVAWTHGDLGNPGGRWDWLRGFVRDFSCRSHVSGKFYWSDPDYLQVGQGTLQEARVRMVICALGGGPAFLSDRMPELPAERLALIPQCLPSYRRCATPVDLFECDDYPHLWDLPVQTSWGRWHVLGLFNLDEHPQTLTLNLGRLGLQPGRKYLLFDYFAGRLLGEVQGLTDLEVQVRVPLPATDARVLKVVEKQERPFVLSTDLHLTQGGVELPEVKWDPRTVTLSGVATRSPGMAGKIFVYVPEGYRTAGQQGRVVTVPVQFKSTRAAWAVKFVRG